MQLAVRRPLDKSPYPAVCEVSGDDVTWVVSAADTAQNGTGECELSYLVGDVVAKSQTWGTLILRSLTGDEPGEPPEDPAKAWFAAIQSQIGDLANLTTKAKDNLVAAINEAAKSGSGGGGSVEMRVDGGYIQYSTDGETWDDLIAVADLKGDTGPAGPQGETGPQGPKGDTGAAGQDGYSPSASVTETDDGAEITITDKTSTTKSTVKNGKDGVTPNIQIGTVTTLDAGVDATASITGTEEEPLLNLGIPKGADGSGGVANATWKHIRDIELTPDAIEAIVTTTDADEPFSFSEILLEFIPNLSGYFYVRANQNFSYSHSLQAWVTNQKYTQMHLGLLGGKLAITGIFRVDGAIGFTNNYGGPLDFDKISIILLGASSAVVSNFTVKIWGR